MIGRKGKWKIGWGFTRACNMACEFCYSKSHRTNSRMPEGYFLAAQRFVVENSSSIQSINYGTGENALASRWWDFVEFVGQRCPEIRQGVTTNGYFAEALRSSPRYRRIAERFIRDVDVSVDSASASDHNALRRHPMAFDWAMRTLGLCEELDLDASIVMVASRTTFHLDNLAGLCELARASQAGLRVNLLRPIDPSLFASALSVSDFFSGTKFLLKTMRVQSLSDPLVSALCGEEKYNGDFTGLRSMRILDDASITPSTYLLCDTWRAASLKTGFSLLLAQSNPVFRRLIDAPLPAACRDCLYAPWCRGGAFDRRWIWHKSLDRPDPYCPLVGRDHCAGKDAHANPLHGMTINRAPERGLVHDGYLPTLMFE